MGHTQGPRITMRPHEMLIAARAEALFTSDLSANLQPSAVQVTEAIRRAVRVHCGTRGCAAEVAAEYGNHPETAARRMRWARSVVETISGRSTDVAPQWPRPGQADAEAA